MAQVWVLTSCYNDYRQHGEYFEGVFLRKPNVEKLMERHGIGEQEAKNILNGEGDKDQSDHWYNLECVKVEDGE